MKHKDLLEKLRLSYLKSLVFNQALTRPFGYPTINWNLIIKTHGSLLHGVSWDDGAKQCLVENLVYLNC
jgi:hypothetical protein